jgi:dUTPase
MNETILSWPKQFQFRKVSAIGTISYAVATVFSLGFLTEAHSYTLIPVGALIGVFAGGTYRALRMASIIAKRKGVEVINSSGHTD